MSSFSLVIKHREYIPSELQVVEKQVLKEPNSVQMIDVHGETVRLQLSNSKSSNWIAVIGYPRDHATVTQQIGACIANHKRAFCYRYDYKLNCMLHTILIKKYVIQFQKRLWTALVRK